MLQKVGLYPWSPTPSSIFRGNPRSVDLRAEVLLPGKTQKLVEEKQGAKVPLGHTSPRIMGEGLKSFNNHPQVCEMDLIPFHEG